MRLYIAQLLLPREVLRDRMGSLQVQARNTRRFDASASPQVMVRELVLDPNANVNYVKSLAVNDFEMSGACEQPPCRQKRCFVNISTP